MPVADAAEAVAGRRARHLEGGAAQQLPSQGATHRHAQLVGRDRRRGEAGDPQLVGATRRGAIDDAQVAQPLPAQPGGAQRALERVGAQIARPGGFFGAGVVSCHVGLVVGGPGPHLGGQGWNAAAERRVVDERGLASIQQHAAGGGQRRLAGGRDGGPHHLAMRGVAQVVAFSAVAVAIGGGESADHDRQGLVGGTTGPRLPFARDHPGDVFLDGDRLRAHRSTARRQADPDRAPLAGRAQGLVGGHRQRVRDRRGWGRCSRRGRRSRLDRRDDRAGGRWCRHGGIGEQVPGNVRGIDAGTARCGHDRCPGRNRAGREGNDQAQGPAAGHRGRPGLGQRSGLSASNGAGRAVLGGATHAVAQQRPRRRRHGDGGVWADTQYPGNGREQLPRRSRRAGQADDGRGPRRGLGNRRQPGPSAHVVQRRPRQARRQLHEEVVAGVGQRLGRRQGTLEVRMRADEAAAVGGGDPPAQMPLTRRHEARLGRGRQCEDLGNRTGQHRRVEHLGVLLRHDPSRRPVERQRRRLAGARRGRLRRSHRDRQPHRRHEPDRRPAPRVPPAPCAGTVAGDPASRERAQSTVVQPGRQRHGMVLSPSVL